MIQTALGELSFHIGFKKKIDVEFFTKKYAAILKVCAYDEKDGITEEQLKTLENIQKNLKSQLALAEKMLVKSEGQAEAEKYIIRTLLVQRNGEFAFLCDDENNEKMGIAIIVNPKDKIMLQDEYL